MNTRATVLTTTFLLGLAAGGYAMYHLYRNWKLTENSERTTATVMYLDTPLRRIRGEIRDYHRVGGYDEDCYKTVVFYTRGGERVVWQSAISVDVPDWLRGLDPSEDRAASILYDPNDPQYWEFDKPMAMFVNWFALLIGGMALMSLSFGPYDAVMRRLRETNGERESTLAPIRRRLFAPNKQGKTPETPTAPRPESSPASARQRGEHSFDPGMDESSQPVSMDDREDCGDWNASEDSDRAPKPIRDSMTEAANPTKDGFEVTEDPFATMR